MAGTKQTVRVSVSGRAPRRSIAGKPAHGLANEVLNSYCEKSVTSVLFANSECCDQKKYSITFEKSDIAVQFTKSEVKYLFGDTIAEFFENFPDRQFSVPALYSLGLPEAVDDNGNKNSRIGHDWIIENIWISKGVRGEFVDCFYAEEHGSRKTHRIDLYTFRIEFDGSAQEKQTGCSATPGTDPSGRGKWSYGGTSRFEAIKNIYATCIKARGRKFKILHSGGRTRSLQQSSFHLREIEVKFRDETSLCIEASLCNALEILLGGDQAVSCWRSLIERLRKNEILDDELFTRIVKLSSDEQHLRDEMASSVKSETRGKFRDFKDASKFVQEKVHVVSLEHMKIGGHITKSLEVSDLENTGKIYLVSVIANDGFSHAVCIDGRRNLLFDPVELNAMKLCQEALELCVGTNHSFSHIMDVRIVMPMQQKKSGKGTKRGKKRSRARREEEERTT